MLFLNANEKIALALNKKISFTRNETKKIRVFTILIVGGSKLVGVYDIGHQVQADLQKVYNLAVDEPGQGTFRHQLPYHFHSEMVV